MTRDQKGISTFTLFLFIIVLAVTVGIGWFIWSTEANSVSPTTPEARTEKVGVSPITQIAAETPEQQLRNLDGWGSRNNFLSSGFSFRLPIIGWRISSISGEDGGSRTWIREDPGYGNSTDGAQFTIEIDIENTASAASSYNGVISTGMGTTLGVLPNGIEIWQSNKATFERSKDIMYCSGGDHTHYVQLSAKSDNKLYVKLPNGKYMTYIAKFCHNTTGQDLRLDYEEQANSEEMLVAARILASIQYQPRWELPPANQEE